MCFICADIFPFGRRSSKSLTVVVEARSPQSAINKHDSRRTLHWLETRQNKVVSSTMRRKAMTCHCPFNWLYLEPRVGRFQMQPAPTYSHQSSPKIERSLVAGRGGQWDLLGVIKKQQARAIRIVISWHQRFTWKSQTSALHHIKFDTCDYKLRNQ
jgi:hypothetical protein